MVQIIESNKRPSFGQKFSNAVGAGVQGANQLYQQHKEKEALSKALGPDSAGLPRDFQKMTYEAKLKQETDLAKFIQKKQMMDEIFNPQASQKSTGNMLRGQSDQIPEGENEQQEHELHPGFDATKFSDQDIVRATMVDPALGNALAKAKDVALRENASQEKFKEKKFESERQYHTQFSKPVEEKANALRSTLPKQEQAIDYARQAVESGDVGSFSMNHLADIFNLPSLRNAKGAQLVLAGKEQLLPNLGRISAKAQNLYMEKRMSTMIPQVGLKDEANLTMQEMLEGEAEMDRAYLSELDRISEKDMKEYGFVKKDIDQRARQATKHKEKEIAKRTSYRMKEVEEKAKGASALKSEVGKNVVKGTPMTLAMMSQYWKKFGDDALTVAEKNGYYIPTKEEFLIFEQRPSEFRETL